MADVLKIKNKDTGQWEKVTALKGDKGDTGDAATISLGAVATGDPGTDVVINNSGDEHAAVFNFMIPRGDKGEKGDQGPAGPGSGDMLAEVYDTQNKKTDLFSYVDSHHDSTKQNVLTDDDKQAIADLHKDLTKLSEFIDDLGSSPTHTHKQYEISDLSDIRKGAALGATSLQLTQKGEALGVAELDDNGKVPSSQLPSYVDDVEEYDSIEDFPEEGESGKIYIALNTNITYRWGGTTYVPIGSDLALGETETSAYRGDRGKEAYDHSQITEGNPHGTVLSDFDITATATEINLLSGVTATTTEINYLSGITSNVQEQINAINSEINDAESALAGI